MGLVGSTSAQAWMRSNPYVYRNGNQTYILPNNNSQTSQQKLKGTGSIYYGSLKITTTKEEDPTTHVSKDVKVFKVFIRNCGDVTLNTTKDDEKNLKDGNQIELRFEASRSCNVSSWKKI